MSEKGKIFDLSARFQAMKNRNTPEEDPNIAEPAEPEGAEIHDLAHHNFRIRGLSAEDRPSPPTPPEETVPFKPHRSNGLSLRTFAGLGGLMADEGLASTFDHLFAHTAEDQRKFEHIRAIEETLRSLQGIGRNFEQNVAMRRGILRSEGTEDLVTTFWSASPHVVSGKPAFFTALLDELEERGYFDVSPTRPPESL